MVIMNKRKCIHDCKNQIHPLKVCMDLADETNTKMMNIVTKAKRLHCNELQTQFDTTANNTIQNVTVEHKYFLKHVFALRVNQKKKKNCTVEREKKGNCNRRLKNSPLLDWSKLESFGYQVI